MKAGELHGDGCKKKSEGGGVCTGMVFTTLGRKGVNGGMRCHGDGFQTFQGRGGINGDRRLQGDEPKHEF